jgi:hypothetical protein
MGLDAPNPRLLILELATPPVKFNFIKQIKGNTTPTLVSIPQFYFRNP